MSGPEAEARWPGRVAVGIVRGDPPQVFLAATESALSEVLARQVVAPHPGLDPAAALEIDAALAEERWTDSLVLWMHATGQVVDAYPDEEIVTEEVLRELHDRT